MKHSRRLIVVALGLGLLAGACLGDDGTKQPADVDSAYVRTFCQAIGKAQDVLLASPGTTDRFSERVISANQKIVDAMSKAKPPADAQSWHEEWLKAARATISKMKARDPSAAGDVLDVMPGPWPGRFDQLFADLPECKKVNQRAPQPAGTAMPGTNSHSNVVAKQSGPDEVRVSFDYAYGADPSGTPITDITVSALNADGKLVAGSVPVVTPIRKGSAHMDVVVKLPAALMAATKAFSVCFTRAGDPDLGCARVAFTGQ